MFGFTATEIPDADDVHTTIHAKTVVNMFDSVLQMLGPDTELVEEILSQVGQRHKNHGVKKEMFPHMGTALIDALETTLGTDAFQNEHREAWDEVYEELSAIIVRSMG